MGGGKRVGGGFQLLTGMMMKRGCSLTLDGMWYRSWGSPVKLYSTHINHYFGCPLCFKFQIRILLRSEVRAVSFSLIFAVSAINLIKITVENQNQKLLKDFY